MLPFLQPFWFKKAGAIFRIVVHHSPITKPHLFNLPKRRSLALPFSTFPQLIPLNPALKLSQESRYSVS